MLLRNTETALTQTKQELRELRVLYDASVKEVAEVGKRADAEVCFGVSVGWCVGVLMLVC